MKTLLIMVKYHYLNFADPKCFAQKASCEGLEIYFPFILIAAAADMLDIGASWVADAMK